MHFKVAGGDTILSEWLGKTEVVRSMVASLIGSSKDEVAFTTSTGCGLNIVINGLPWSKGDNVVFPEWEHNAMDTMTLRKHGVQIRVVKAKDGRIELGDLEKAVDDYTRLIQVSQVSYTNGFRFNLREVADIAHAHGAKLMVDATQAIGALRTNVKDEDVDFLSAAPYKYLMGPAGLAFLYINKDSIADLTPDRVGWKNQIWEGERAEQLPENRNTAAKFEYGTLHFQGMYGLEKSLEYISRIGTQNIEGKIVELTDYLWNRMKDLGSNMYTPEDNESPIVSFMQKDATKLAASLRDRKIKVTGRETHGGHIRVSTHFYNTKRDIDHFMDTFLQARSEL